MSAGVHCLSCSLRVLRFEGVRVSGLVQGLRGLWGLFFWVMGIQWFWVIYIGGL